jgi:hypothetical protein
MYKYLGRLITMQSTIYCTEPRVYLKGVKQSGDAFILDIVRICEYNPKQVYSYSKITVKKNEFIGIREIEGKITFYFKNFPTIIIPRPSDMKILDVMLQFSMDSVDAIDLLDQRTFQTGT